MRPAVTVAFLVYRSTDWLAFCLEGLSYAKNETPYRVMVVGNDAEESVRATGRLDVDWRNPDPAEHYISRVYRAWNAAVDSAGTDLVCLLNSDMYVSDHWLDSLVDCYERGRTLPTSLLVESGRMPSGLPDYVRDFGLTPETFDREGFVQHAADIRRSGQTSPGGLYMPVLIDKPTFQRLGGYPLGNPPGTTGDKDLFRRYAEEGYAHLTCHGSVVYHAIEGEQRG